jgi:hypothetical protein
MQDWSSCLVNIPGAEGGVPTVKCLEVVFANILFMAVSLAVLALFVMLVVGGFRFLTAGGDAKAATAAKQTLTYAVIGIVLMALAFLIFRLIEFFTGVNVTIFKIVPNP